MTTARLPSPRTTCDPFLRNACRCSGGTAERWAGDGPRRRKNGPCGRWETSWDKWCFGDQLASQSRAATRNWVPAAMAKAHKFSGSQVAVSPNVTRNQEKILPMLSGRAAAALPANLPRARPRACTCLLTHSFKPLFSGGLGAGAGAFPPPLVSASTRVEIAIPMAVRIDAMVIPCSRNRVRMRSANVVSSWRSRLNVS